MAGIWAQENTRAALFDAMPRGEIFASNGPRIRVRFLASFKFSAQTLNQADLVAKAYAQGVPMGGVLSNTKDRVPQFLLWAVRDFNEGWLQRAQIVKGWLEDGKSYETVCDVACSDGLQVDPNTRRCPDNGAQVNLDDCSIPTQKCATKLNAHWTDPDCNPQQEAFYYKRVPENPSCRWSTRDAISAGIKPNPHLQAVQQERAWSSPIWFGPSR